MKTSKSSEKVLTAFFQIKKELKNPEKTARNPFTNSMYVPLDSLIEYIKPILNKHSLELVQEAYGDGETIYIRNTIYHTESMEYIEFEPFGIKTEKISAQGTGSATTYGRRYSICPIFGIVESNDDDGNGAEESGDMTYEDALGLKLRFGKHKDKTLEIILKEDKQYVLEYLVDKGDPKIKKAIQVIVDYVETERKARAEAKLKEKEELEARLKAEVEKKVEDAMAENK